MNKNHLLHRKYSYNSQLLFWHNCYFHENTSFLMPYHRRLPSIGLQLLINCKPLLHLSEEMEIVRWNGWCLNCIHLKLKSSCDSVRGKCYCKVKQYLILFYCPKLCPFGKACGCQWAFYVCTKHKFCSNQDRWLQCHAWPLQAFPWNVRKVVRQLWNHDYTFHEQVDSFFQQCLLSL